MIILSTNPFDLCAEMLTNKTHFPGFREFADKRNSAEHLTGAMARYLGGEIVQIDYDTEVMEIAFQDEEKAVLLKLCLGQAELRETRTA